MRIVTLVPILLVAVGCSSRSPGGLDGAVDAALDSTPDVAEDVGPDAVDADSGRVDSGGDAAVPRGWGLLSLNLHCLATEGTGFATNAERFDAIAAEVASRGVRVLLLQEVCDDGSADAFDMLSRALSSRTGAAWGGGQAFAHDAWVGTPEEARESVAILADVPVGDLSTHVHHAQGALKRVVLSGELGGDLSGLRVATFHLDHADDAARLVQARELATAALLHASSANVVVGGDLNDRVGTAPHGAMGILGYEDASAALSPTRIDHVFVHRGAAVGALDAELLFRSSPVSDHPGVLVRLESRPAPPVLFTTLEVGADAGLGNALFVRGDQAPLSWDEGLPAISAGPSLWRFATTELSGAFEYKVLVDDVRWSAGANFAGMAGMANGATVSAFE